MERGGRKYMDRWRKRRSVRYAAALVVSLVAYLLQWVIWPFIPPSPQLFFYPAVFVAAWFGGARPGYFATFVSCLAIAYGFLPPEGLFGVADPHDALDLALFAIVASGISATTGRLHAALIEQKKATREAQRARQAVEATWAMVAHDLRTPLSVIQLSSTDLERRMQRGDVDPLRIERVVQAIHRSTHRASDLVDDAMDAMRLANGVMTIAIEPCSVKKLCLDALDAVAVLAQRKSIELSTNADEHAMVACDEPRVIQVLSNLLGNAVKFTPPGGRVVLDAVREGRDIRFSVVDTGPGIPEDQIEAIFTKFWTRDAGTGVGLGLWIAKAIVEAHESRLVVSSRVGAGTTFSFLLRCVGP